MPGRGRSRGARPLNLTPQSIDADPLANAVMFPSRMAPSDTADEAERPGWKHLDAVEAYLEEGRAPERALDFVNVGVILLGLSANSATQQQTDDGMRRDPCAADAILTSFTPEVGARAAVFLTHSLAALLVMVDSLAQPRGRVVFDCLSDLFPDADLALLDDVLGYVDGWSGTPQARAILSFHAITLAIGESAARQLPAFRSVADLEWPGWFGAVRAEWDITTMVFDAAWDIAAEDLLALWE